MRPTPLAYLLLGSWGMIGLLVFALAGCAPAGFHYESAPRGRAERAYTTQDNPFGQSRSMGRRVLVADQPWTVRDSRDALLMAGIAYGAFFMVEQAR